MTEETVTGKDGTRLFVRAWRPNARPRALVVITHGFESHSGMFAWFAEQLAELDIAVFAYDLRGNGKSEGERAYVEHFQDYLDDLDAVVTFAKARDPSLPTYVFGHSAGGVIASAYALAHQRELAGLISESFAHELPASRASLALVKALSYIAPHAQVLKLHDDYFSRDPAFVAAMKADPLVVHTGATARAVAEMTRGNDRLGRNFSKLTLPVLILHGTQDQVTRPSGSRRFFEEASSPDKMLEMYEGHAHDLLNDVDRQLVADDILAWITSRLTQPEVARPTEERPSLVT